MRLTLLLLRLTLLFLLLRLTLLLLFAGEDAEGDEVVFDLLIGGEDGLAIEGGGVVIAGASLLGETASATSIEEGFTEGRAERIDQAGLVEERGDGFALEARGSAEIERGEVGSARDADLLVGGGGAALCGSDVGTSLEELRGEAGRKCGRIVGQRQGRGREGEGGGRLPDEDGDGVLILGARDGNVGGLDAGVLELGLGLGDIGLDRDAAEETVVGDADGVFVLRDGVVEELLLCVGCPEFEVVESEFGLEREEDGLAVGGGGLRLFASCCDVAANSAPEINFVVELERE